MLPFLVLGAGTTLYILWALTAFPTQVYVRGNSIVYINQATNNTAVAVLYVIATCGSLFFSKIKMMVVFGAANLAILLAVMAFKRYAFTSLWCAYAAIASVIILCLLLDEQRRAAVRLRIGPMKFQQKDFQSSDGAKTPGPPPLNPLPPNHL